MSFYITMIKKKRKKTRGNFDKLYLLMFASVKDTVKKMKNVL